jgi:uncharacterized protein YqcC (DUF446 family)
VALFDEKLGRKWPARAVPQQSSLKSGRLLEPYSRLADIVLELESALREQALWEEVVPPRESLQSVHPFCVDTLTFTQWLQFVFIERVKLIVERQAPLPVSSEIVPMAQEWFGQSAYAGKQIIHILGNFDELIGRPDSE